MEVRQKIAELLTENTGTHFLDSGSAYSRNWEKNQDRNFEDEPYQTINEWGITTSIYHYLMEHLSITENSEALQKEYEKMVENSEESHLADMFEFLEKLWDDGRSGDDDYLIGKPDSIENTYNHDNLLGQDIQYGLFYIPDGYQSGEYYIILQIHGGCDIRGGYTSPYIFSVSYPDSFICDMTHASVETKKGNTYYTDDGYHFYNEDNGDEKEWDEVYEEGINP